MVDSSIAGSRTAARVHPKNACRVAMALSMALFLAGCGGSSEEGSSSSSSSSSIFSRIFSAGNVAKSPGTITPLAVSAGDVSVSAYTENNKLMRADENVGALGNNLFGEHVNLYDGSTEFVQTDVSLPGNSALPVAVGRRLTTGNDHLVTGLFGDWDLDIPHLHGVFSSGTGWKVGLGVSSATSAICTQFGPPPQVLGQSNQGAFNPEEYWHGSFLYVPGAGSQEILQANTSAAAVNPTGSLADTGVTPIKLTTKSRWTLICGTPLQGGGGEGFTAISPDGTRYRFDQMVTRPYPQINKPVGTPPQLAGAAPLTANKASGGIAPNAAAIGYILKRKEVWILPTLVTDRFGNTVSYNYSSPGSWQLTSITSTESSGLTRSLTFQYQANSILVSSVSDGTRTWTYGYADFYILGTLYGQKLVSVTLPSGGGAWSIDMGGVGTPRNDALGQDGSCDAIPQSGLYAATGTMIHPSGAVGTFKFAPVLHGRSYVGRYCRGSDVDGTGWSYYPRYFTSYAMQSKTLSGPGMPAVNLALANPGGTTWLYQYYDPNTSDADKASWSTCSGCVDTKPVTVTDPQQVQTRYTFGTRFQVTDGQLLQVDGGWDGTNAVRTTVHRYASPTAGPYPDVIGYSVQARTAGDLSTRYTPEYLKAITQQTTTFNWQASQFDRLARPIEVTRSSTLGYSRTEQTVYADIGDTRFTDAWVLGALAAVNRLSGPSGTFQEEIEGHTFDYSKLKPNSDRSFGRTVQSYTYLVDGNLATRADGLGQTTTFTNYKTGIARDITYADSATEHADVNDLGLITAVRNAYGTTTGYGYDGMGRLSMITPPPEPGMSYYPTTLTFTQVGVDEAGLTAGHWRQTVTTNAAITVRYFDALWRPVLTQTMDAASSGDTSTAVLKRFDANGRLSFESYPGRNNEIPSIAATPLGTRRYYDAIGRTIRVEQDSEQGVLSTQTSYLNGFTRAVTNPRGYVTTTGWFQAWDTPSEDLPVTIQLPEQVTVGIGREFFFGKPMTITRAGSGASVTRSYVYDGYRRLCKTIEPESGATVQQLDAADNLSWQASGLSLPNASSCDQSAVPAARKISYTYDTRNRLSTTSYADGSQNISRSYTPDGLLQQIATQGGGVNPITWTYGYNNRRLLTQEVYTWGDPNNNWTFGWGIDFYGHAASLTDPWGLVTQYAPNALGQPTQVVGYGSNVTNFATGVSYYPNGAVASYTLGNGVVHNTALNTRGLPLRITYAGIAQDSYSYDANGNITAITDEKEGVNNRSMPVYDGLDRLRQANGPWGAGSFTYDAVDNLTASTVGGRSLNHNIDAATNRLSSLTGSQNLSIGYDANGNVTSRGGQGFVFDLGNRMTSAPGKATYAYDGHGRRNLVWFTGSEYMHQAYTRDGKLRLGWRPSEGVTRYVYMGDKLIAEQANTGSVTYSHTDALGSPIAKTDSGGNLISRTRYEPYGATVAGSTNPTKIGFTGHVNDPDTGLVYMQQRYYDPIAGRFLSVDPVTTDANTGSAFGRYHYVNNNPYRYTDPTGTESELPDAVLKMRAISDAHDLGQSTTAAASAFTGSRGSSEAAGKAQGADKPNARVITGNAYIDKTTDKLDDVALSATITVGSGKGPIYGTAVHTLFGNRVKALGRDDLWVERSFDITGLVPYSSSGSIRTDVILGPSPLQPIAIYDLKTGNARLTDARAAEIRSKFPGFKGPIMAIYPQVPGDQ